MAKKQATSKKTPKKQAKAKPGAARSGSKAATAGKSHARSSSASAPTSPTKRPAKAKKASASKTSKPTKRTAKKTAAPTAPTAPTRVRKPVAKKNGQVVAEDPKSAVDVPRATRPPSRIDSRDLAIELARLAFDDKCSDIVLLDVRGLSSISDYVVVASGTSDRQMRAVADHAEDLGASLGHPPYRSNKDPRALWLLIDFSDVVIHIFEPNTRAHYDIEMMWGDAKRIDWERPAGKIRKPAQTSARKTRSSS
ncbi:MAG: ribosome silencing factor [Phycisphaeraceae bacterium]|nr:MAG: ribosome silencing factor [Phycisphaeraceae bacterium]